MIKCGLARKGMAPLVVELSTGLFIDPVESAIEGITIRMISREVSKDVFPRSMAAPLPPSSQGVLACDLLLMQYSGRTEPRANGAQLCQWKR